MRRRQRHGEAKNAAVAAGRTLGEFARVWLEDRRPHLTAAVHYDYGLQLNKHLLGDPLARQSLIEIHDGNRLVARLQAKQTRSGEALSARRINMVIAQLRTIFATALRQKLIGDDPMRYVQNFRERKPDVDPFDLGEVLRTLDAAKDWKRPFLTVLLFAGLRPNEALALAWDSVAFEHSLIRVRRTAVGRFDYNLPKTRASARDVEMSETVRAALVEQRVRSQLCGELVLSVG